MPDTDVPDPNEGERGKRSKDLPNQRLSPVLNPLLANQLGRWAEIYYTTPAERRDEAVGQLLRELEAEARSGEISSQTTPIQDKTAVAVSPGILTPAHMEHGNPIVPPLEKLATASRTESLHPIAETNDTEALPDIDFRDPPLGAPDSARVGTHPSAQLSSEWPESSLPWPGQPVVASSQVEEPVPANTQVPDLHATEEEIEVPDSHGEKLPENMLSSAGTAVAASLDPTQESEAHERPQLWEPEFAPTSSTHHPTDFSLFHFPHATIPVASDKRWISRGLAVAALLIVGSVLLIWTLHRGSATPATIASSQSGTASSQQSGAEFPSATSQTKIAETAGVDKSAPFLPPQTAEKHTPSSSTASEAEKPAAERSIIQRPVTQGTEIQRSGNEKPPVETVVADKSAAESSDPDLQAGLKYLRGDASERNSAEAARYLWKSVQRQNGRALVELAGLYANGDGVAKDCDQAKILMQAASHHKIPNLEAALETLHQAGCE